MTKDETSVSDPSQVRKRGRPKKVKEEDVQQDQEIGGGVAASAATLPGSSAATGTQRTTRGRPKRGDVKNVEQEQEAKDTAAASTTVALEPTAATGTQRQTKGRPKKKVVEKETHQEEETEDTDLALMTENLDAVAIGTQRSTRGRPKKGEEKDAQPEQEIGGVVTAATLDSSTAAGAQRSTRGRPKKVVKEDDAMEEQGTEDPVANTHGPALLGLLRNALATGTLRSSVLRPKQEVAEDVQQEDANIASTSATLDSGITTLPPQTKGRPRRKLVRKESPQEQEAGDGVDAASAVAPIPATAAGTHRRGRSKKDVSEEKIQEKDGVEQAQASGSSAAASNGGLFGLLKDTVARATKRSPKKASKVGKFNSTEEDELDGDDGEITIVPTKRAATKTQPRTRARRGTVDDMDEEKIPMLGKPHEVGDDINVGATSSAKEKKTRSGSKATRSRASAPSPSSSMDDLQEGVSIMDLSPPSSPMHDSLEALFSRELDMGAAPKYKKGSEKTKSTLQTGDEKEKAPRSKATWTDEETEHLINMIIEHGTGWTKLQKLDAAGDHVFKHKDAPNGGDLKDKAHLIKRDWKLSKKPLPANFHNFNLRPREKKQLQDKGIDPEDKVHSTDKNGEKLWF